MNHRPRGLWLLVLLAAAAMAASRDDGRSRRSRDPRDESRSGRGESRSSRDGPRTPREESRPSADAPRPPGDESAAAPRAAPTAAPSETPPVAPKAPATEIATAPAAMTAAAPGAATAGAPTAAPAAAGSTPGWAPLWDDYRILTDRNIFVRNRTRPSSGRPPMMSTAPAVGRGDQPVLTGVIQQGADCLAFFEDPRSGRTAFVQVGDALGAGKVTAITLDAVEYTRDGMTTKIAIGRDLSGAVASLRKPAAPPVSPAAPATAAAPAAVTPGAAPAVTLPGMSPAVQAPAPTPAGPAAAPGDTTGSSEAAILERMRLRRLEQELQK